MPSAVTRAASRSCRSGVLDGEQGPGVPGGQHAGGDPALDGRGELEQPQRVADLGARAADALGELVVGAPEVLEQLAVGRRLLERVELGAVQVLQQRVAQHVVVVGVPHDRRDGGEAGLLGGAPAALAHDQLVGVLAGAAHDDRLQQPDLADGVHQLGERLLLEDLARLAGVGPHLRRWGARRTRSRPPAASVGRPPAWSAATWASRRRPVARRRRCDVGAVEPAPSVARRAASGGAVGISDPRPRPRPRRTGLGVDVIVVLPWWRSRGPPPDS